MEFTAIVRMKKTKVAQTGVITSKKLAEFSGQKVKVIVVLFDA